MYPPLEFAANRSEMFDPKVTAAALFDRARRTAIAKRFLNALRPKVRQIRHLCGCAAADHYEGVRVVRVADIRGSESRADEFDIDFNPLAEHLEDRWVRVAVAMQEGIPLPLIELIELDGEYYVRDGHHRVSVARALGIDQLEAVVIRYGLREAA